MLYFLVGGGWKQDVGHSHLEKMSHNCLFLSLSVSDRCIIFFPPIWIADASFDRNKLKLTWVEWVNYCTRLYLSRLCMHCIFVLVCVKKKNNIENFSYIVIYDLIKIPLVNIQSSFLSIFVMTCPHPCPFLIPNEVTCVINNLCVWWFEMVMRLISVLVEIQHHIFIS